MTAQIMDGLVIGGNEYRVASQIYLPKRRSKRWRHITMVPPSEWQATLMGSTLCCRRYSAMWKITDGKLFLKYLDGCYKLLNPEQPLWAEWVTSQLRVVDTECWFCNYDSTFEREFGLSVVRGIVAPNVVVA